MGSARPRRRRVRRHDGESAVYGVLPGGERPRGRLSGCAGQQARPVEENVRRAALGGLRHEGHGTGHGDKPRRRDLYGQRPRRRDPDRERRLSLRPADADERGVQLVGTKDRHGHPRRHVGRRRGVELREYRARRSRLPRGKRQPDEVRRRDGLRRRRVVRHLRVLVRKARIGAHPDDLHSGKRDAQLLREARQIQVSRERV